MSNKSEKKTIRLTLAPGDAALVAKIAEEAGISETDVLRTGLKLMAAYNKAQKENSSLIVENEEKNTRTKLLVV